MTDNQLLSAMSEIIDTKLQPIKEDLSALNPKVALMDLTLGNETNRNIRLLAENHSNLIDKLNQSIKVSDKTAIYEIQVNILTGKVERLERELADIKAHIA